MQEYEPLPAYLNVGRAADIKNKKERYIYRAMEIIPGVAIWSTFVITVALAYFQPVLVSVLVLSFSMYWMLRVYYFTLHGKAAYTRMRKHEKVDWVEKLNELKPEEVTADVHHWGQVWHLVILPMYNESFDLARETIEGILRTDWPKERMLLVLATEERAGEEAQEVARQVRAKYGDRFARMLVTVHPDGLAGELSGKGSNAAWAGKRAKEELIDTLNIPYEHVLVSSLDIDTIVFPRYFSCLTYHFLTSENPYRASYQPIPLFINNIWHAPLLSRLSAFSSSFWEVMNQERPEKKLTFSSHSMPFKTLVEVGFWNKNAVSEDSRIFWLCFLRFNGDYRVVSLYYPVAMDANLAPTFWGTMKNVYRQQRRWGYGAADIPYFVYGYFKNGNISARKMWQYGFTVAEGFYSWGTHAILLFVMGWLPIFLGGDQFNSTVLSYSLPRMTQFIMTFAMIGLVATAYYSIVVLPPRPAGFGRWRYGLFMAQWVFTPFNLIVFGALPAIDAQTRLMFGKYLGFWVTPKHRAEESPLTKASKKHPAS
ncbi:MAG: glycosyltransferase family 2 protein [Candidatus Spechtbacterales bacterium]